MSLEDRLRQSFTAAIDDVRTRLESEVQAALEAARAEAEQATANAVADARSAAERDLAQSFADEKAALAAAHEAALEELRRTAESTLNAARQEGESALHAARHDADALVAAREQAELALNAARAEMERVQLEVARLRQQADADVAALRAAEQAVSTAHERVASSARLMLDGVKALDDATSLSEVLDALAGAAASASGRAAMLVVKGDRLLGWRTVGFGELDAQARGIETHSHDDALTRAVATGRPVTTGTGPASSAPAFTQSAEGRTGIAVPLLVGGRAVAVVYADPVGSASEAAPVHAAIEVLVRHAGRCLEALTVQRAVQAKASSSNPSVRVGTPA
jgi:hypothetical protein